MNESFSVVNDNSQGLKLKFKIGVILFILGLFVLMNSHFDYSTWGYLSFLKILKLPVSDIISYFISFGLMILGSILFTYKSTAQLKVISVFSKRMTLYHFSAYIFAIIGLSIFSLAWFKLLPNEQSTLFLWSSLSALTISIGFYTYGNYAKELAGIKNNYTYFNSLSSNGVLGWAVGVLLTFFYIQLYWNSKSLEGFIHLFDPLSFLLRGKAADQWFLYGTLYTFVILFLGIKFMIKYRHNRYQLIRTIVVILSQLIFAYFLPHILEALNWNSAVDSKGDYLGYYNTNLINTWPLNKDFFADYSLDAMVQPAYQPIGMSYLVWGILMFLVVTPVATYYLGKRWYCSWFCGCGGLAETAGDSFRQLSSKSTKSWKIERWVIHSVMVFVLIFTIAILWTYFSGKEYAIGFFTVNKLGFFISASIVLILCGTVTYLGFKKYKSNWLGVATVIFAFILVFLILAFALGNSNAFIIKSTSLKKAYAFFIGSTFSGVIGVGFYPILGTRVWCRFGCPMAGYMGLFQRFKSKFRITTNGGQCISCGNCSTYCEQGIDVRAYAQRQENIVRASCVGCGICSAVCPRGVLKLENGPEEGRIK
jgi:polyferredoxin